MGTKLRRIQGANKTINVLQVLRKPWLWLVSDEKPDYKITGKYLFFSPDKEKLIELATNEMKKHGFHKAKVNDKLRFENDRDYVLCLYYADDSRKYELAERNKQEYHVRYRYWKSDEDTL